MRELQTRIIADLDVVPRIDPAEEVRKRVTFLKDYLRRTGAAGFVLGISGGQDSSLAGRLAQLAVEELAEEGVQAMFIAARLPYNVQADEDDAQLALTFIRPQRSVAFNIHRAVDGFEAEYADAVGTEMTDFTKGNVKARARMIAQYAMAGQEGLLVIGTDHAAEAVTGIEAVHVGPDDAKRLITAALDAAAAGRFSPVIAETLPLEQAAEAHRLLERRQAIGKVLLSL